jgi:hypothetical protein
MRNRFLLPLSLACLTGCVNQITVAYQCEPMGAKLVEDGTGAVFPCPGRAVYGVDAQQRAQGFKMVDGMTAIWPSGAKTHVSSITLPIANGTQQTLTFTRDPNAPGAELDAENGWQVQQLAVQQQAAQAAQDEANAQDLRNTLAAAALIAQAAVSRPYYPQTVCDSEPYFNGVQTICH